MEIGELAAEFVALVLSGEAVPAEGEVPDTTRYTMVALLEAAGFAGAAVRIGWLKGSYLEQDGSETGDTYTVNATSPLAVSVEAKDHYVATGWLDCVWRYVQVHAQEQWPLPRIAEGVVREVERSVPLAPITISSSGDQLLEYPPLLVAFGLRYLVNHTKDKAVLVACVGVHARCNGWVDRGIANREHDVLVCRSCHLRVEFPKNVVTYGELRAYMDTLFASAP